MTSPTVKPNPASTVTSKSLSLLLKPAKRSSITAKSVVAKGIIMKVEKSDQVAIKAIDALKTKTTTKVLEPNSIKRSNQEILLQATANTNAATKAPTSQIM